MCLSCFFDDEEKQTEAVTVENYVPFGIKEVEVVIPPRPKMYNPDASTHTDPYIHNEQWHTLKKSPAKERAYERQNRKKAMEMLICAAKPIHAVMDRCSRQYNNCSNNNHKKNSIKCDQTNKCTNNLRATTAAATARRVKGKIRCMRRLFFLSSAAVPYLNVCLCVCVVCLAWSVLCVAHCFGGGKKND